MHNVPWGAKATRRRQWGARDFKTSFMFLMEVMLMMLEMQEMQPHNVQEQTQSSHPKFQDFQTRKIDQTQKISEMSGMLGMQPAGHKKVQKPGWFDISHHQPSKADTSYAPQIPLKKTSKNKIMQGMFRSSCSVQLGNCKKHSFLEIQTVPQRMTVLGCIQTPNRPIPTSLETAKHH